MTKSAHKLDTYKDGWQHIEFCTVCGCEGNELNIFECKPQPDKKDEVQLELFVDRPLERY